MTLRDKVYERDHGVCAKCGLDTKTLMEVGQYLMKECRWKRSEWKYILKQAKIKTAPGLTYWQADHIIAKTEGGSDELDNRRTLCITCHERETAYLLKRKGRTSSKVWKFRARMRRQGRNT